MKSYTTMDSVDDLYIRDSPGAPIDEQVKTYYKLQARCPYPILLYISYTYTLTKIYTFLTLFKTTVSHQKKETVNSNLIQLDFQKADERSRPGHQPRDERYLITNIQTKFGTLDNYNIDKYYIAILVNMVIYVHRPSKYYLFIG